MSLHMTIFNLGFLYFWGIVFFITTTLVWFLKREKAQEYEDYTGKNVAEQNLSIVESYKQLLKIFKLPAIQWTVVVLLTCKVFFLLNS